MAIIKCPECGHQTSDKAPFCPSCGIEIAGKIVKCPNCGEIYFKSEVVCPHCHKAAEFETETGGEAAITDTEDDIPSVKGKAGIPANETDNGYPNNNGKRKKSNVATVIVSAIIAAAVMGACLYFYKTAQDEKENEEYMYAMRSEDPTILQTYINNFKNAPKEHLDSVTVHLKKILDEDQEWTNAVVSNSKTVLAKYLEDYPRSPHRQEALDKIDSIDWAKTSHLNTVEAYRAYMNEHPYGAHYDEASAVLKKIETQEVSIEDKLTVSNIFHNFFVAINTRNESGLTANIGERINFMGKQKATKEDVVSYMRNLYKDDVKSMLWKIKGSHDIEKKEVGDSLYEYNTTFMADQEVVKTDGSKVFNKYRINGVVDSQGRIAEMSVTKVTE